MKTIRVSRKLFATYRSINQAIAHAEPGSRIEVEPGVYRENVSINKYIEIVGVGEKERTIIQGLERPSVYMNAGYAVMKNLTIKQPRTRNMDTVYIPNGALILDDCDILARSSVGIMVLGSEAEPIFRRCTIHSEQNAAVEIQNQGKTILEDCHLSTGNYASIIIREGNPTIRRCTITGDEGYGIYVEDRGRGYFEECNIFGFDYSPAIGILRGNPHFVRCRIHDGQDSGVVIEEGRGRFQDCRFFSFERELPAVRLSKSAQPRFERCEFRNCKGGAFLFEKNASGLIEDSDLYGFTHAPAVTIRSDAHPQFIRCRIHDGNLEGVVCTDGGKGLLESCEIYSFNGNMIAILDLSQLDLLRCKIAKGNGHAIFIAQRSKGIIQDSHIDQFPKFAAIHVTQAADPNVIQCEISHSMNGVKVTENGHGTFEKCVFRKIEGDVWEIDQGNPNIYLCREEGKSSQNDSLSHDEPLNVSEPLQELLYQLGQIIGQQQAKKELREFILYLDYLQDRIKMGIKTLEQPDLHAIFIGPANTGKKQVANIYSKLLKELGYVHDAKLTMLSVTNEIIQADQIEPAVWSKKMEQATDGVMYIYDFPHLESSELEDQFLSFLKTFLDTSKHLGSVVVVLAVLEKQWKQWLERMPRLSTFRQYHFHDYLPEEMVEIFHRIANQEDYHIHLTARDQLGKEMIHLWNLEIPKGNYERVYDYFQQVKVVHSLRCSKLPKHLRTKEVLTTIMPEDLQLNGDDIRPDHKEWVKLLRKKK